MMALDLRLEFAGSLGFGFCGPLAAAVVRPRDGGLSLLSLVLIIFHLAGDIAVFTAAALRLNYGFSLGAEPSTPTKRASPSFISPDGVEGFNFEGGIDEGDLSPTKKTKIKRGRATPPQHKLPILFF